MRDKGKGTVLKRNGSYVARYRWSDSLGHYEKSFSGKTELEALQRLKAFQEKLRRGQAVAGRDITFGQWYEEAMESYFRPRLRTSTISQYESLYRNHLIHLKDAKLGGLSVDVLEETIGRAKGGRTREILRRLLVNLLNHAVRRGKLAYNAASRTQTIHYERQEKQPLALQDARRIIEATSCPTHRTLFEFMLLTGARLGETLGLKWADIGEGFVHIERQLQRCRKQRKLVLAACKTERSKRCLPITKDLEEKLLGLPRRGEHVFSSKAAGPLEPRNVSRTLKQSCEMAGLRPIGCHIFRHSFATLMADSDVALHVISATLGHTQIATTLRYAKVRPEIMRCATSRVASAWADALSEKSADQG